MSDPSDAVLGDEEGVMRGDRMIPAHILSLPALVSSEMRRRMTARLPDVPRPIPGTNAAWRAFEHATPGEVDEYVGALLDSTSITLELQDFGDIACHVLRPRNGTDVVDQLLVHLHGGGYARGLVKRLEQAGIRVQLDARNEKIGYKVREHALAKIKFMLVVGRVEAANSTVALRELGGPERDLTADQAVDLILTSSRPPDQRHQGGRTQQDL